jgi:DNA repair protein RecN (Recombination protein N)
MLSHLAIRNLAVIESAELELGPGLNVLTGETGAGKSVVIGALSLVAGGRARADAIRMGADQAEVQAELVFPAGSPVSRRLGELALVDSQAGSEANGELLVRRVIAAGGRGRVFLNGVLSTAGTLGEVVGDALDLTGQHEHTVLAEPRHHLAFVDRCGGHARELEAYSRAWEAYRQVRDATRALEQDERRRVEREDFLRFQLEEIDRVAPRAGEDAELAAEQERLVHAERLMGGARLAEDLLTAREGAAAAQLADVIRTLERLSGIDARLAEPKRRLESARLEVQDVAFELRRYADKVDLDPRRLAEVEERTEALKRLVRKHGPTVAEVLAKADELKQELGRYESLGHALAVAEKHLAVVEGELARAGTALSEARAHAARLLEERVGRELGELRMPDAAVSIGFERSVVPGPEGFERVELRIRTNRGDPFLPVGSVASGGELSRLLLALKCAALDAEVAEVCVFDEVDAGIGGAVAEVVGRKLRAIARTRQVIVITHLPQVAAHADHHLKVEKVEVGERVVTRVRRLGAAERTDEIARMLGGVRVTERTRAHAEELIGGVLQ